MCTTDESNRERPPVRPQTTPAWPHASQVGLADRGTDLLDRTYPDTDADAVEARLSAWAV